MKGTNLGEFDQHTILEMAALVRARSMCDQLWDRIPLFAWKKV
jgi:hypothetical protein